MALNILGEEKEELIDLNGINAHTPA